jgi:hypothetical protein
MSGRRGSGSHYEYPEPANLAPVTPSSGQSRPVYTPPSPYYTPPPNDMRHPQQGPGHPYERRSSPSPHNSPYPQMHPGQGDPQNQMPPQDGVYAQNPMANSINSSRGGLNVRDMLNPGGDHSQDGHPDQQRPPSTDQSESRDPNQGRSSTDSDMLNALNRRGLSK